MLKCDRVFSAPIEPCACVRGHPGRCIRQSALDRAIRTAMHRRIPADLYDTLEKEADRAK